MNDQEIETTFLDALEHCRSLDNYRCQPTNLVWSAIELFAEVGKFPYRLLTLCNQYKLEVERADSAIENYARSVDNWKVKGTIFGVKDQCNIAHFFLNVHTKNFPFFRGENWTPERICEFLQEWGGIDLSSLIVDDRERTEELQQDLLRVNNAAIEAIMASSNDLKPKSLNTTPETSRKD
jgi:hypothetical protein